MTTIELTLEKELGLRAGFYRVKVEGKTLTFDVSEESQTVATPKKKRKMSEILAEYSGRAYKDAKEVDEFIKAERAAWDK